MNSQRPAREPDALCEQRLAVMCVSAQVEAVHLQSTSAVLCKAANLAAGYRSHQQSLGALGECCNPSPAADWYLIQKPKQTSQTHVQGSGSRSVWGGGVEVCSVETGDLVTQK
ncbi:hypothetical protein CCMA1212_000180 [Trichoderma ghanense]|uniref:Uncharacterized protein n=1 Tax=Trichoderma ghanense TaxID=65468 RepID=A0ABY2HK85_9HYPO